MVAESEVSGNRPGQKSALLLNSRNDAASDRMSVRIGRSDRRTQSQHDIMDYVTRQAPYVN